MEFIISFYYQMEHLTLIIDIFTHKALHCVHKENM